MAVFWFLAVGFVGASTRSIVQQVFQPSMSAPDRLRTEDCTEALAQAAAKLETHEQTDIRAARASDWVHEWSHQLDRLSDTCGDGDQAVIQMTAAVARLQHQLQRHAQIIDYEHARLVRILRQHVPSRALNE